MSEAKLDAWGDQGDEWNYLMAARGSTQRCLYLHLQDHHNQLRAGLAEIYIGSDLIGVRLRPGDMVTTAERVWLVDPDDRGGAEGPVTATRATLEVRVYRPFATPVRRAYPLRMAARCPRPSGRPARRQRSQ